MLGLLVPFLLLLALPPLLVPFFCRDLWAFLLMAWTSQRCRRRLAQRPPSTLLERFHWRVQRQPGRILLRFQDQELSYGDLELWSNRAARVLRRRLRPRRGEPVAVFLPNGPHYVGTWLALAKLGCPMACVNSNARGPALRGALEAAGVQSVIASAELSPALEALPPPRPRVLYLSSEPPVPGAEALLGAISAASPEPLRPRHRSAPGGEDTALHIYTSGTTGLPKAAVVTEQKLLAAASLAKLCGLRPGDVVYTTLPLYHAAGLMVGLGGCIEVGATCVLRSKFSASHFWDECRRYDVTVIQYVGELLRYVCHTPKRPNDRDHRVRLAIGNGLRGDVWKTFLDRFGPISIREFYGATEGNGGFINYTGKVGAVGRANMFIKFFAPFELIKYNVEKEEPVRDERGLCIPVGPGETGLLVTKITKRTPFHGYAGDSMKTERKILRNVLVPGDAFFNSGDLLMMDHEKFIYFQDRIGDTFRWKGENVATTEVEAALAMVDFIQEVNVYGVSVPGCEGRCGMAAIRLKPGQTFDGQKLYSFVEDALPRYAAPRFLRVQDALETTATFKQCKSRLVTEGFDLKLIRDPLFFCHDQAKAYVPLTPELHTRILDMTLGF
ncbi:long-chain fatty acid transport protein 2-like [Guaruba guarouba]